MSYQEAFKPISHLAEAAGIREAVEKYKDCPQIVIDKHPSAGTITRRCSHGI